MFLDRVIRFGKKLGVQGKCYSPKKLKSLIEVTNVAHLKVQVTITMCSAPKSTVFNLQYEPESTGSKVQYEPLLFSVA